MLTHVHPRYKKYYGKASGRLCRLFPSWNKTPTAEIFCAELMLGLQRLGPSRVDQSELLQRLDPYIHVYTHVCMCTHTNAHINTHVKTC